MRLGWLTKHRHIGKSPFTNSLGFLLIIGAAVLVALHFRGVDVLEKIESAYFFYFSDTSSHQVNIEPESYDVTSGPKAATTEGTTTGITQAENDQDRLSHAKELEGIPRIALHPLSFSQYSQHHKNGKEVAELVTSLLMIKFGNNEHYELLDRSQVSALFTEKSLILANDTQGSNQATLGKLPISNFTLVGSLFSSEQGTSYSLKLIRNSTGQILGASRFSYSMDAIDESIQASSAFIQQLVSNAQSLINKERHKKIAFGHFADISHNDAELNEGRNITERLIETFVNKEDYSVLSRTQLFPLVFEEYLRILQYSDEHQDSIRQVTDYLVHGKYRINRSKPGHPISVYLYIDMVKHGRELIVLQAESWPDAYEKVNDAIVKFIPGSDNRISANNISKSKDLFLQALRIRGMLHYEKILNGELPPTSNDIESFSATYKAENLAPARELIERSLALNPHNPFSKLASAMYLRTDGDTKKSNKIIMEVLRNQESASAEIAYRLLNNQKYKLKSKISAQDFVPIVGANRAKKVYKSLFDQEYLKTSGDRVNFNSNKKSDQVFNYPHMLSLNNLDEDTAIQIFEKLRSAYYVPGTQVRFSKPRRFHPRDAHKLRTWYQNTYQEKHNIEAIVHFDIASTTSNIYINQATTLPSVEFYSESESESDARRLSNLEIAVDGFSSGAYLDTSYLKAIVLLGNSLCQPMIGRCASGKMIHSWVVDNAKAANLKGRGGIYYNVTKDVEEKDRLIFLAADAVDRVAEANFSDMFQYSLTEGKYFANKSNKKLVALLPDENTSVPKNDIEKIAYAYAELIRSHCIQLTRDQRELRYPQKYAGPLKDLAEFSQRSSEAALLSKSLLAGIEADYPTVYPYIVAHSKSRSPFVIKLQDDLVERVVSGKIVPIKISEFMKIALNIFEARMSSRDIKTAKQYINYFVDYYGITENTAMDFAHLYHRVGDSVKSNKLLRDYGKKSFTISNFTLPHVDGDYVSKGFNKNGQLKFDHKRNRNIYIVYTTSFTYANGKKFLYGLGEIPVKWELSSKNLPEEWKKYSSKTRRYNGNTNPRHRDLFAFGNGGKYTGKRLWTSPVLVKANEKPVAASISMRSLEFIEVAALSETELSLPENNIESLFFKGYKFDSTEKSAIKGFSNKTTIGPVQDSYFPTSLSKSRRISVVMEQLFEKGYLTVAGLPVFDSNNSLYKKIEEDFPNYSEMERRGLRAALFAATKVKGAGYVEIHQKSGNTWKLAPQLIPEDAIPNRGFGIATAIHNDYALICDYKDGLYSYKKINNQWELQQRIESRCKNVEMNNEWAIVSSKEKTFVYKNNDGFLQKTQTLVVEDFLLKQDKRQRFTYYGNSMALTKDTLVISNAYGGPGGKGEVYIFNLLNNKWQQSQVLLPGKNVHGFGESVSANNDFIIISNPSTGDLDTPLFHSGSVYVFARANPSWTLKAHLVAKGRPKNIEFGNRVMLKAGQHPSLLIKSHKEVFRYNL